MEKFQRTLRTAANALYELVERDHAEGISEAEYSAVRATADNLMVAANMLQLRREGNDPGPLFVEAEETPKAPAPKKKKIIINQVKARAAKASK